MVVGLRRRSRRLRSSVPRAAGALCVCRFGVWRSGEVGAATA
jgi:hypothetical protein